MTNSAASPVKEKRTADMEIAVIAKIGRMIQSIPEISGGRQRVLQYLHARYCLTQGNSQGLSGGGGIGFGN